MRTATLLFAVLLVTTGLAMAAAPTATAHPCIDPSDEDKCGGCSKPFPHLHMCGVSAPLELPTTT